MYDPSILPISSSIGYPVVDVPREVKRFYRSPHLDALGIALQYIDDLPSGFKARLGRYLDVEEIEDVRSFYSGVKKLRDGEKPTRDEILVISAPEGSLRHLSDCFLDASANEPIGHASSVFVERNICKPLRAASLFIKHTPTTVREWAVSIADEWYPEQPEKGFDCKNGQRTDPGGRRR